MCSLRLVSRLTAGMALQAAHVDLRSIVAVESARQLHPARLAHVLPQMRRSRSISCAAFVDSTPFTGPIIGFGCLHCDLWLVWEVKCWSLALTTVNSAQTAQWFEAS